MYRKKGRKKGKEYPPNPTFFDINDEIRTDVTVDMPLFCILDTFPPPSIFVTLADFGECCCR